MIKSIIKTLNTIPVIPAQTLEEYRQYLTVNYPQLTSGDMERVLEQVINQTLDNYLIQFSVEYRRQLKELLLESLMGIQPFAVYASDILKAGLKLAYQSPEFYNEIAAWIGQFEFADISRETAVNYILHHNELSNQPVGSPYSVLGQENTPSQGVMPEDSPTVLFSAVDPKQWATAVEPEKCQNPLGFTAGFDNPYCIDDETMEKESADSGDFYLNLVTRFESIEKMLKLYFRKNRVKYGKSAIAVLMIILTLGACLWLFNNHTRAKENLEAPALPLKAPLAGTNPVTATVQTPKHNQPPEDGIASSQVKPDYNRPSPIPAAPNTIIGGYIKMKTSQGIQEVPVRRYFERKLRIKATAYDLSIASCGKDINHPEYGITRTGTRAKRGRTIAVDPRIIPLGRKVYIKFPPKYSHMNGIYVAEDTGSKIKGYRIDIFLGEDRDGNVAVKREARRFGHRKVEVYLLQE